MDRESKNEVTQAFANYIRKAFLKYQEREIGKGRPIPTQADFARWLGVDTTSLSNWMTATRPPTIENADIVADKLGLEVWEILRLSPRMSKDRNLQKIARLWAKLSDQQRRELAERADNFAGDWNEASSNKENSAATS